MQITPVNMVQYPLYARYPYTNVYSSYNNCFNPGYSYGQVCGNYYGYQPWTNSSGSSPMENSMTINGYYPNYQRMNSVYRPYNNSCQYPWSSAYGQTNWFNPLQAYNQMAPWMAYCNYDKWAPIRMNFNTGMYYTWPMMNYYSNQMMYPNYFHPSLTHWGVQQTVAMPGCESQQNKTLQQKSSSESRILNVTSSDVIRDYNLPPAVTKKTRSDIPRPSVDHSDIKEAEKNGDDMDLPYLFRVSDTSIKQIASSRSFGPSMVYNTESDNKPLSARW